MITEIILLLGLSQLILGIYLWLQVKDLYQYPNRLGFPIIGNLYYFYKHYIAYSMDSVFNNTSKIGDELGEDMYFTFLHGKKAVVISCPHIIEKIAFHPHMADKSGIYGIVTGLLKGIFGITKSNSEWKLRRKEMVIALKKSNIEGSFHDVFVKQGKELNKYIEVDKKHVDSHYYSMFFSLNAVRVTLFGLKKKLPLHSGIKHVLDMLLYCGSIGMANPVFGYLFFQIFGILDNLIFGKVIKLQKKMFDAIEKEVNRVAQDSSVGKIILISKIDISNLPLSVVVGLRNKKRNNSINEVKKEVYEMIMAGSHTVSVALAGALTFLATLPEVQEKAWQEQYEIFGNDDRDITLADIKKMIYLDRFYKELLRFFSPPYIGKATTGEVITDGVTIPSGTLVVILSFKMRTDPKYWENPLMFNPDRFIDDKRPTYSYTPFGIGVRGCIGMQYANSEIKIALSTVLRRFKLSTTEKYENLIFEKNLMTEIKNLPNIVAEERQYSL